MTNTEAFVRGVITGAGIVSLVTAILIVKDVGAQVKPKCYKVNLTSDEGWGSRITGTVCEQ